jgi:hypothetical protein
MMSVSTRTGEDRVSADWLVRARLRHEVDTLCLHEFRPGLALVLRRHPYESSMMQGGADQFRERQVRSVSDGHVHRLLDARTGIEHH